MDWKKLKATIGENNNFNNKRFVLSWAGKTDAYRNLQTPATKTLITDGEESENFEQYK